MADLPTEGVIKPSYHVFVKIAAVWGNSHTPPAEATTKRRRSQLRPRRKRETLMTDPAPNIEWEYFDRDTLGVISVGALISAEAGGLPIYRVMRLGDGRAWLRDVLEGSDRVTPLAGFHWRICDPRR